MNLAHLKPEEQMAVQADCKACFYRHKKPTVGIPNYAKLYGEWHAWVKAEIDKFPEPMRQAVKGALNRRLKDDR